MRLLRESAPRKTHLACDSRDEMPTCRYQSGTNECIGDLCIDFRQTDEIANLSTTSPSAAAAT